MRWLRRTAVAVATLAIVLQWANTRASILHVNQDPAHPVILKTYVFYHLMAMGLREGRIGQVDLVAVRRYAAMNDRSAPFERAPRDGPHEWVSYYSLDVGYSFIVEAARLAFPLLPDNHLRALMLQLVVDAALVYFVFFVFSHWNLWLGLIAAFLYSSNAPFYDLVSFAYYYYWDVPLTFFALGSLILAHHRSDEATFWLTAAGCALGCGVWLRASWWPLSLFLVLVAASAPVLRGKLLIPLVAFAVVATPQVIRSSLARGQLALTTRAAWHVALVGLGYYPNPYGLQDRDDGVFDLTRQKYGVRYNEMDYFEHDQAARKEFLSIWKSDRSFIIRSFAGRLEESLAGRAKSDVLSFLFLDNLTYRLLCLLGLVALIVRGGEKRLLAIAAGGSYAIYVVLTCLFYFVGLAYDSVSEVTLFFLFLGGIEAALQAAQRMVGTKIQWPRPIAAAGVGGSSSESGGRNV